MDNKKKEIRFLVKEELHNKMQKKADDCDVPLASYVKSHIEKWAGKLNE